MALLIMSCSLRTGVGVFEGSDPPNIEKAVKHNKHEPRIDPSMIKELRRVFGSEIVFRRSRAICMGCFSISLPSPSGIGKI